MTDSVLYDTTDGVAVITLNRPDRLNAWSPDMTDGYLAALDRASADGEARAVIVTGAGRGFCAGADMTLLAGLADGVPRVANADRPPYQLEPAVPKPVIAAINGACAGLGLVRALYCDLRIAVRGAKITTAFARRGLVAEYGMSWLLPRIVGLPTALDLLVSGRTLLAEEAVELGLVDRLVDEDALGAATAYAGELARLSSPASMRDMKRQVWGDLTSTLEQSVERAEALMRASFDRPDLAEGVTSYLERRDPKFPPLGN
jgi:enoyl-CoA hydratase/carnithine racemase